jgi:hypothetical protein
MPDIAQQLSHMYLLPTYWGKSQIRVRVGNVMIEVVEVEGEVSNLSEGLWQVHQAFQA